MPIYSTVLGRRAEGQAFGAQYWAMNMRQPVLFTTAVEALAADGVGIFVELRPASHPAAVGAADRAGRDDDRVRTPGRAGAGCFPDHRRRPLGGRLPDRLAARDAGGRRTVQLPLYPWQRERHWVEDGGNAAPAASGIRASRTAARRRGTRMALPSAMGTVRSARRRTAKAAPTAVPWLVLSGDEAMGSAVAVAPAAAGVDSHIGTA